MLGLKALADDKLSNQVVSDEYLLSEKFADDLDSVDPIAHTRELFHMPPQKADPSNDSLVYLCGNSLGLMPRNTETAMQNVFSDWKLKAVEAHFNSDKPWAAIDEFATPHVAKVVGGLQDEVAVCNSLSCNLHLLLTSFYRPSGSRTKILMEEGAFCSDSHVVESQVKLHGLDPNTHIIRLKPRAGETYLRTEDILTTLDAEGDSVATVLLPGIQFYTGQYFDIPTITKHAQTKGCFVGWDLAHAAGNVELHLHDWGVDFAAWCHYKYLNAGPGAVGGLFVHEKHDDHKFPILSGWWGQRLEDRFAMDSVWRRKKGAQAYQMSNPPVTSVICVEEAAKITADTTMAALRLKSLSLTAYLEALLSILCKDACSVITPTDPAQRGAQLSVFLNGEDGAGRDSSSVAAALIERGVIVDKRKPSVVRISPAPLYNTYKDVYRAVIALRDVLQA